MHFCVFFWGWIETPPKVPTKGRGSLQTGLRPFSEVLSPVDSRSNLLEGCPLECLGMANRPGHNRQDEHLEQSRRNRAGEESGGQRSGWDMPQTRFLGLEWNGTCGIAGYELNRMGLVTYLLPHENDLPDLRMEGRTSDQTWGSQEGSLLSQEGKTLLGRAGCIWVRKRVWC